MQEERLEDAHKFKLWKKKLKENDLTVNHIDEKFTRRNHLGEVLFATVLLDATDPNGRKIPPLCLVKGEVVCVLVCFIDRDTQEKYLLLVKQRRIAEGGFTYEQPAGMVDGTKSPEEIALQEVREETGLHLTTEQLIDLSNGKRLFPSTGTSDEAMYFFACEITLSKAEIEKFENQTHGEAGENEHITTHVFRFAEAHKKINNTNGLLLNYLYLQKVNDYDLLKQLTL